MTLKEFFKLPRVYLYLLLAPISVLIDLICRLFLNWFVVLFCDKEGNLPRCLYWFQTFDNSCDQGKVARERDILAGKPENTTWDAFWPWPHNGFQRWWNRAAWLWRNCAYGFEYYLLGLKFDPTKWKCIHFEKTAERELEIHIGEGFNIKYKGKWGTCKLGWKASNCYDRASDTYPRQWGDQMRIPFTFSYNPFKRPKKLSQ